MVSSFGRGFAHGVRGALTILRRPRLWPLVAVPFLLSLAALVGVIALVLSWRERWLAWVPGGAWGDVLRPVVEVAGFLLVPIAGLFLFVPLTTLIAAPFNEAIAEAVERQVTGQPGNKLSLGRLLVDLGLAIAHELRKLLRYLLLAGLLLAITIVVPGPGTLIGLVGGAYLTARFAAYDALDATFSRWGWSYADKTAFVRAERGHTLGLGSFVAILLFIPVVNALAMPIAAAGGALLALAVVPPARRG